MKKRKTLFLLNLFILLSLLSCGVTEEELICENSQTVDFELGSICNPKIMSYHFGVEHFSPSDQIKVLSGLQMDGMILQVETENLSNLDSYYKNCKVKNGQFNIYTIFTTFSVNKPKTYTQQLIKIERIYKKIQNQNTTLQVIFEGDKNNCDLTKAIAVIADIAKKHGKSLIIYPHVGYAIETAEEALAQINLINEDNIFLSVHLYHELAAGNENRIEEVILAVSPFIKSVSINGASLSERTNPYLPIGYWGIKPLNSGTYDYSGFYQALHEANYEGPIAIQTWEIQRHFNLSVLDHLPDSRAILLEMSEELCD